MTIRGLGGALFPDARTRASAAWLASCGWLRGTLRAERKQQAKARLA